MTERPPNEVAATPSAANFIDNLERERNEAIADRDAEHMRAVAAEESRDEAWERAETAERELFEARAALVKAEGERDHEHRMYIEATGELDRLGDELDDGSDQELITRVWQIKEAKEAVEASCRSHADAIGVLREAAAKVAEECQTGVGAAFRIRRASVPEVVAQVERERRAEREVVGLAKEWAKTYNAASGCDCAACKLCEALAALPASPPAVIDKADSDVTG